jgi:hypothetical protein
VKKSEDQKRVEAYQQGLRQGRMETAREFWNTQTGANGEKKDQPPPGAVVQSSAYKPHMDEGVNYGATSVYIPSDTGAAPVQNGPVLEPVRTQQP